MNILLVEDDIQKATRLQKFLCESIPHSEVRWVKSVTSAIGSLDDLTPELIVLDMSLPTFEEGRSAFSGGRQQNFGGSEVLGYIKALGIRAPTIVVTQLPDFEANGELMTLNQLDENLRKNFSDVYLGLVQYKNNEESWKDVLMKIIAEMSN